MSTLEKYTAKRRILSATFLSPRELAEHGLSRHRIACLVADGRLVRARNGRYLRAETHPRLLEASRLGGRLDCVSLLAEIGVFVRNRHPLHLQFTPATTRLPERPQHVVAHWRKTECERAALAVDLVSALVQACRCQPARDAVATLDSAWHSGLVREAEIAEIFRRLPRRYRMLRGLLDPRCESGAETLMRLLFRALGCHVEVQVELPGVGRVDLIIDGWLVVECDSKAHHEDWKSQLRDRRRDIAAAGLGYTTIRPVAEDIYHRPDEIVAAMKAILAAHAGRRDPQNSTRRTPLKDPRAPETVERR
ncbi:endonuclease domain-containing protein [Microbacterium sp. E-13]|uniref:endonuclease domain-containing protein n=1 Tax=Microbacterium sp. E-13 TaxID=3404048 RepID=UPI003CF3C838